MAVDISQQAYQAIYQVIQKILGSREEAAGYAEDPKGYLAAEGVADYDMSGVNMQQVVQQAAGESSLPATTKQALQQSYAGGGGQAYTAPPASPPAGYQPADHLIQHINHVTHVTYEGDDYITQQLINQENYDYSTNVDLYGNFAGDVNIDASSVIASGDGAVAAGGDATGVATGDGAVAAGEDIEGPVNTGQFTGIQSDGDVEDTNVNIGGEQTNVQDSQVQNTAFGGGDVTQTQTQIQATDGSAVAFGEGSQATGEQNVEQNQTQIQAENSQVVTQSGSGEQDIDVENDLGGHNGLGGEYGGDEYGGGEYGGDEYGGGEGGGMPPVKTLPSIGGEGESDPTEPSM